MVTEKMKAANAMGGKTARACDGCLRKRARWYCVADDAFLCQGCDSSVHSANQLASRHQRVRLETRTLSSSSNKAMPGALTNVKDGATVPLWHQGFTRKARTPRPNKAILVQQAAKAHEDKVVFISNDEPLVPELGCEEGSLDDDDANADQEQLLCQVPVFDPFEAEINCDMIASENGMVNKDENMFVYGEERTCNDLDDLHGFLPSDMDLTEFAADVESLLGGSNNNNTCLDHEDIKGLDLLDFKEENDNDLCFGDTIVKVKDEEADHQEGIIDCNFDFDLPVIGQDEEDDKVLVPLVDTAMANSTHECNNMVERISLRLDYEAVINAWASQGCPWTTGSRPEFNHDDCWLDCTGACPKHVYHPYGGVGCHVGGGDGGREARVSRYREKRRTRLFSKKIRYEVRKLNAEKRPRMKGRFVKRTSFIGSATFPYLKQ
ncbi:hypothetical protein Dsin_005201 [Dipteronia sinensis]|uniref:Uncharacterized protein n=1 Tax=Dipteronia sinensis TaxID=43782 RepID=A0AAE0EEP5_9ROSI|nr:hypothetical protein Dsin_005201 [Dipteronia sinensis]